MDDPGPCFTPDPAQILHVVKKRVHESTGRVARTRMDHHSCLFVQHCNVGVLIQDLERERFAGYAGRLDGRDLDAYSIALVHRQVGAGIPVRDRDVPRGNQFLNLRSGMASENGDEELIEPVPIGVRRNGEFERHGCAPALTVALRRCFYAASVGRRSISCGCSGDWRDSHTSMIRLRGASTSEMNCDVENPSTSPRGSPR